MTHSFKNNGAGKSTPIEAIAGVKDEKETEIKRIIGVVFDTPWFNEEAKPTAGVEPLSRNA